MRKNIFLSYFKKYAELFKTLEIQLTRGRRIIFRHYAAAEETKI